MVPLDYPMATPDQEMFPLDFEEMVPMD
jgi:hypothetical protein